MFGSENFGFTTAFCARKQKTEEYDLTASSLVVAHTLYDDVQTILRPTCAKNEDDNFPPFKVIASNEIFRRLLLPIQINQVKSPAIFISGEGATNGTTHDAHSK